MEWYDPLTSADEVYEFVAGAGDDSGTGSSLDRDWVEWAENKRTNDPIAYVDPATGKVIAVTEAGARALAVGNTDDLQTMEASQSQIAEFRRAELYAKLKRAAAIGGGALAVYLVGRHFGWWGRRGRYRRR